MSKRLIPFGWLPGHWGLKGLSRELARIEYEYCDDDYMRERKKIELFHDKKERDYKLLELERKYDKISEREYKKRMCEFITNDSERKMQELELKWEDGEVEKNEYEKEKATLQGEPWVVITSINFTEENPDQGLMELDWNDHFITYLQENGYDGIEGSESDIVNAWINEVAKNIAIDAFSGIGDFDDHVDESSGPVIQKRRLKDDDESGRWEAS